MAVYLTDPTSHQTGGEIENLGDIIIKQAIESHLPEGAAEAGEWVGIDGQSGFTELGRNDLFVLAGANILANRPFGNPYVWRPAGRARLRPRYALLFGVGWWQYQPDPDLATRSFYSFYLKPGPVVHSVRDSHTRDMLIKCGVRNVLNTGCPTLWNLPDRLQFRDKASAAVFTLTDYNRDPINDREMVQVLLQEYRDVAYFPQGTDDESYLRDLMGADEAKIRRLPRTIEAYDALLATRDVDYIGTRLHGGIRAMQHGCRALIISVDNRATEIARDTQIAVIERPEIASLRSAIRERLTLDLTINRAAIREFKESLGHTLRRYQTLPARQQSADAAA